MLKELKERLAEPIIESYEEALNAMGNYPPFNSAHEGFAILLEEVEELKAEVFKKEKDYQAMQKEAVQVAAMAIRFINDICLKKGPLNLTLDGHK